MLLNHFKLAWRNLWKDKTFSLLNLFGLSVAFTAAVLLSMYALFQLSFDRFHSHGEDLYQVYTSYQTPKGPQAGNSYPVPFAGALQEEVPGIKGITRYIGSSELVVRSGNQLDLSTIYVDPDFLEMFSFPVLKGNQQNPIADRSDIALTREAAKIIFGKEEVIGETVTLLRDGEEIPYQVSAILENPPLNSSFQFDLVLNFANLPDFVYGDNLDAWDKSNHEVFVQLKPGMAPEMFERATRSFTELHFEESLLAAERDGAQPDQNGLYQQIRLIPFREISFAVFEAGFAKISKTLPFLVLGVAFLILFIASVNFINMSVAKGAQRLREIGVRRVLGAERFQLFLQFWGESLMLFLGAAIIGGIAASYLLEPFQTLFGTTASFEAISSPKMILYALLTLLLITLFAGGYPAMLLSKLGVLQTLKGQVQVGKGNLVRNGLIVIQFGIAILLISGTLVLWNQLEFMKTKDLGYDKEQVIAFPLNGKGEPAIVLERLRNELREDPNILSMTAATNILGLGKDHSRSTSVLGFEFEGRGVSTHMLITDYDYVETLGLELLAGRSFDRAYASDSMAVVINESMARELGKDPIINTRLMLDDSTAYSVIGVVKDYNFQDLDRKIEPLTIFLDPEWKYLRHAYVKVAPQGISASFEKIRETWKEVQPQAEFLGSFLNENVDRTFKRERNMSLLITSGSVIAIILSCTGLFAISLLVVAQRRKEIGIRKVIGASVPGITMMLTLDFLKLVALAFLIGAPLAWWLSGRWIENYPYRTELHIWIFLAAGAIAFIIALLTVSIQAVQAARSNPVESLKAE